MADKSRSTARGIVLKDILARFNKGLASVSDLEQELASQAFIYGIPPRGDIDALLAWEERLLPLASELEGELRNLKHEPDSERIADLAAVLSAAGRLLGPKFEGTVCFEAGFRLLDLGERGRAADFLERAWLLLEPHDPFLAAQAGSHFVDCLRQELRYDRLVGAGHKLLATAKLNHFQGIEALALMDLGAGYSRTGDHAKAETLLDQALTLRRSLSNEICQKQSVASEGTFLRTIALAARQRGDFSTALRAFEQSRTCYSAEGAQDNAAYMLSEIGITWDMAGEQGRAREFLNKAADEAESLEMIAESRRWRGEFPALDETKDAARAHSIIAYAGTLLKGPVPQVAQARNLARQCIREAQTLRDRRLEAESRNLLAATHSADDQLFQALTAQQAAVRVAETVKDPFWELQFRGNLANYLARRGRLDASEKELRRALKLGREVRTGPLATEIRQATGAGVARIYEQLALSLVGRWERPDGTSPEPRVGELFALAQEVRAVNLATWIAIEEAIESNAQRELSKYLLDLRCANVRVEVAAQEGQTGKLAELFEEQDRLSKEFTAASERLGQKIPLEAPIVLLNEASRLLRRDECLIDLFSISEGIIVIRVGPKEDTTVTFCPWPRRERLDLIRRWDAAVVCSGAELAHGEGSFEARESACSEILAELQSKFIKTLSWAIGQQKSVQRVFLVPHRELFQIPYWGLADTVPNLRLSILPGVNILGLLKQRSRDIAGERQYISDVTGTLYHSISEVGSLPDFEPLNGTVDQLIQHFSETHLLHFAGHGVFDAEHPYRSGIVIAAETNEPARPLGASTIFGEELLTAAEILSRVSMPKCFLTVLSACSSGLPRVHPASEFVSLPAAFMVAGARNVVASLWPVNDGAACLLMKTFYRILCQNRHLSVPPSAALARARTVISEMSRAEVIETLGSDHGLPNSDPPFRSSVYNMCFEHFGVD